MKNRRNIPGYLSSIEYQGGRVGILLFHSLGGTPLEMRYLAQGLSRAGYTVHCPMLPGMTNGTDVLKLSTWEDWYEAAEAAFDKISETCDSVFVGGLSAGSMIALRLADRRSDEVAGHLVYSPTFWPNGWTIPWYFNFYRTVWQRWVAVLFNFKQREPYGIKDERLRKFMIEAFKAEGRDIGQFYQRHGLMVLQFRRLADAVKRNLHKLKAPTIIMHPRHDDQSDLSNALKMQRLLSGHVETLILDDCYHMIPLDRQRDIVLERSLDFLDRQLVAQGLEKDRADQSGLTRDEVAESINDSEGEKAAKTVAAE